MKRSTTLIIPWLITLTTAGKAEIWRPLQPRVVIYYGGQSPSHSPGNAAVPMGTRPNLASPGAVTEPLTNKAVIRKPCPAPNAHLACRYEDESDQYPRPLNIGEDGTLRVKIDDQWREVERSIIEGLLPGYRKMANHPLVKLFLAKYDRQREEETPPKPKPIARKSEEKKKFESPPVTDGKQIVGDARNIPAGLKFKRGNETWEFVRALTKPYPTWPGGKYIQQLVLVKNGKGQETVVDLWGLERLTRQRLNVAGPNFVSQRSPGALNPTKHDHYFTQIPLDAWLDNDDREMAEKSKFSSVPQGHNGQNRAGDDPNWPNWDLARKFGIGIFGKRNWTAAANQQERIVIVDGDKVYAWLGNEKRNVALTPVDGTEVKRGTILRTDSGELYEYVAEETRLLRKVESTAKSAASEPGT